MQSVIKRPCPATRIHFQPYGQPNVERKTTTGERHPAETRGRHICRPYSDYVNCIRRAGCPHPAASLRGYPSTGSHPRRGRRPRRPGSLLPPPIPGKTPGPGMPGPYRAAVGKPPTVRKRPRRGQDPSLRTDPSASARTPPQVRAATTSTGSHPRRGRRPRRPGNLPSPPIPGKTPGPGMPGPYRAAVGMPHAVHKRPRRGQDPSLRTAPSTSARTPPQVRAATRQRAATHIGGGVHDAPETSRHRPSPGHPPGRACPAPTARRRASPMPSANAHGGVKTPPYGLTHQRVPRPLPRGGGHAPCRP